MIGVRLVPLLVAAGHDVAAMTRSEEKAACLLDLGGEPVVCDVFDLAFLLRAVVGFRPDVVIHELTDLPDDPARIPELAAANNRVRREGTANLLVAAMAAGATQFIAQSVAWTLPGEGAAATEALERAVLGVGGVVIRYGQLYGPGTYYDTFPPPRPRVHVDEAARRTLDTLDAPTGVMVVTDSGGE